MGIDAGGRLHARGRVGLILGPLLLVLLLLLPPPPGLDAAAWRVAALAALMATWWVTEPVPLPVTGLLPIALIPLLGVGDAAQAAAPFANPVIFLFLGGFLLAMAVERWRLHERIAYATAGLVGTSPRAVVGGFMVATWALSMWISNTAAVLLMIPMALSILELLGPGVEEEQRRRLAHALLLGTAYAASIGGLATLLGTPPNAFLAAFAEAELGRPIGFGEWMIVGLPLATVGLAIAWWLLTAVLFRTNIPELPGGREAIRTRKWGLGSMSRAEWRVAAVFGTVASLWVARPLLEDTVSLLRALDDAGVAVLGAVALFLIPSGTGRPLLVWADARTLPWNVLLLFGGGLSLASAMTRTGLAAWLGGSLERLDVLPLVAIVAILAGTVLLLTELTSNTAVAAAFLPVAAAVAPVLGLDPLILMVPAALAASCAFMLPVATPPNAVVYGTGEVGIPAMARAGAVLNLVFLTLVVVHALTLARWVLA